MKFSVKERKPSAEVSFEVANGMVQFTVTALDNDQISLDYVGKPRTSAKIRAALADCIVGWNLEREDGTPWECTAENKALLIPDLVNLAVKEKKAEDGAVLIPEGMPLGLTLFNFASTPENFLKN